MKYRVILRARSIFSCLAGGALLCSVALAADNPLFRELAYGDPVATVQQKLQNDAVVAVDQKEPFTEAGYYVQLGPIPFLLKPLLAAGVLDSVQLISALPITAENYYASIPKLQKIAERYLDSNYGGSSVSIENALLPSDKLLLKSKQMEPLATWHGEEVVAQLGVQAIGSNFHMIISMQFDAEVSRYAEMERSEEYVKYMQKSNRRKNLSEKLGRVFGNSSANQ